MDEDKLASKFGEEATDLPLPKPALEALSHALRSEGSAAHATVPSTIVYGFNELTAKELQEIQPVWETLPSIVKHRILRALNEASEAMFELSFREIAMLGLDDAGSHVRSTAIELLWTDESVDAMRKLMQMAEADPDSTVRIRALESLGRFILLGEYGDIPAELASQAQALTYKIHTDPKEPAEIRRRALEALANSSHASAEPLIRAAYADGNHELKVGAIFAMGRTCNKIWREQLLDELESTDHECVYEAIRAAGQIQLKAAVGRIGAFTLSDDPALQMIAVWSLGEIGGRQAFEILTSLEENANDDDIAAAIDESLDAAGFSLSFASLDLELDDE